MAISISNAFVTLFDAEVKQAYQADRLPSMHDMVVHIDHIAGTGNSCDSVSNRNTN